MKTRVARPCCSKETFANEVEARRRLDKMQALGLRSVLPIGVERCHNGWHLKFPAPNSGPSPKVRAQVEARDGNRCVKCGQPVARDEDSLHHRWPRGRGGPDTVENLVVLCGSTGVTGHHGWVEKNRAVSYKLGYLVETGIDPADKPVLVAGKGWMYATADGRWITPEEYGQDPAELPFDPITEALTDPFVRYAVPPAHP